MAQALHAYDLPLAAATTPQDASMPRRCGKLMANCAGRSSSRVDYRQRLDLGLCNVHVAVHSNRLRFGRQRLVRRHPSPRRVMVKNCDRLIGLSFRARAHHVTVKPAGRGNRPMRNGLQGSLHPCCRCALSSALYFLRRACRRILATPHCEEPLRHSHWLGFRSFTAYHEPRRTRA